MNESFWSNKTVFITGHTGFKGSWLSLWLSTLGANVVGYALAPVTNPNLFSLLALDEHITSITADVRNLATLNKAIDNAKPDIIIHMAAQPLVRQSYAAPVETYQTNVMGTVNIMECFRLSESARVLVNVTTDKCYENKEWCWGYREDDRLGGHDPYSNSKACSEMVTNAFRASFFNPNSITEHNKVVATARAGNVIGGGDWSDDRLIPDFFRAFKTGVPMKVRNSSAMRPWQHVLEPLRGYIMLAEKLWADPVTFSGAWNFGPDDNNNVTVKMVLSQLQKWWPKVKVVSDSTEQPHEASQLALDIKKVKSKLKWQPSLNLEASLKLTSDCYQAYFEKKDIKDIMLSQMAFFSKEVKKEEVL